MPFGKNKKLSMPKPKKRKVEAREEAAQLEEETGETGADEQGFGSNVRTESLS